LKHNSKIPGYILAGGDSKRFGENKALFPVDGTSMIKRSVNLLSPLVSSINIVTKKNDDYKELGARILIDSLEVQTPLAGILRGLEDTDDWGLFLACDLPNMNSNIISKLLNSIGDSYESEQINAIVAVTGEDELQPLVACYHSSGTATIISGIEENSSMKKWLNDLKIKQIKFEDGEPFLNINRKEDLSNL